MPFDIQELLKSVPWQVTTLAGLIVIDVVLGIAKSIKIKQFEWAKLADFYQTNVLPYLLGYVVFYFVVGYVIPAEQLGQLGEPITQGTVTLAWSTLVIRLGKSIKDNFTALYQQT